MTESATQLMGQSMGQSMGQPMGQPMSQPMSEPSAKGASVAAPGPTGPSALVVIDVQRQVVDGGWDADGVVERIARLQDRARAEGVPIIHVQHSDEQMPIGSDGWQMVDAVAPRTGEPVVGKRFPDSFADTNLRDLLDSLGTRHVVIAGAQSDWCIRTTALRALAEGFDMTLVEDCHTTGDARFDDPRAGEVDISATQIVVHTNMYFCWLDYPGQHSTIVPADKVAFLH